MVRLIIYVFLFIANFLGAIVCAWHLQHDGLVADWVFLGNKPSPKVKRVNDYD